ncbi:MAG: hypothetical protein IPH45_00720 [Bacteroidales bacterium]|nr:hypothetical protein [Bacteroidales bacterium]
MRKVIIILLCMASLLSCKTLYGQTKPVATDTVRLYKNIETYSGRNQFTRFMYRLIFKPVSDNVKKSDSRKKKYKRSVQKPYSNFEGKIIRNISIVTLDPFGYTVGDTLKYNLNFLTAAGNGLHVKSNILLSGIYCSSIKIRCLTHCL